MARREIIRTSDDRNTISIRRCLDILHEGAVVVDCGSRHGEVLHEISDKIPGLDCTAIDFHNKTEGNVRFIKSNLEKPISQIESNSADMVICNDVLEHVENKFQLLSELSRITKKHAIISLPNTQHYRYANGLRRGSMRSKYDFMVPDGSDRHRWITYYKVNWQFVETEFDVVSTHGVLWRPRDRWMSQLKPKRYIMNQVFFLTKKT